MYYGVRDKIISMRVSSKLLSDVQKIIDSYTSVCSGRGGRIYYDSRVPGYDSSYEKLSIADVFEKALKDFVKDIPFNPSAM